MKKVGLRTKIEASMVILLLLAVGIGSVMSVTRTITDSSDDVETFIRNSNGRYWAATGANIQVAIDDLTTGGTVSLPECNISVSSSITLLDDVNILGVGKASQLYLADGADVDVLQITGKSNICIEKIYIDGNNGTQTAYIGLIDIDGVSDNITIRDCYLHNSMKSSIDCQEGSKNILVEGCHIEGINVEADKYPGGIWFSGESCIARNNFIKDTYAAGIIMEAASGYPSSKYHIIDGNEMTGRMGGGVYMEGTGSQNYMKSSNTTIVNNYVHDISSTAYAVPASSYSIGIIVTENSTCSNNRVVNVHKYGIEVLGNNSIISNNIIDDVELYDGIYVTFGTPTCKVTITGNIITNVLRSGINIGQDTYQAIVHDNVIRTCGDNGIVISMPATGYISISGNFIYDIVAVGIEITNCNSTITGNYLEDIRGSYGIYTAASAIIKDNELHDVVAGIRADTDGTPQIGMIVSDNKIYDASNHCIFVRNFDWATISGNQAYNIAYAGIIFEDATNASITGNVLSGIGSWSGIKIDTCYDCIVTSNRCCDFTTGIEEANTCSYNIYSLNNVRGCTNGISESGDGNVNANNLEPT